jgi:hypothetical protein
VEVGEADGERVEFGMSFGEQDADVFGVVPGERFRHGEFLKASFRASAFGLRLILQGLKPDARF